MDPYHNSHSDPDHEAKLEIAPVATDGVLLYGGPGGELGGHNVTQWSNTVAHLRGEEVSHSVRCKNV